MYGEEADYCLRAPGRVVLAPGAARSATRSATPPGRRRSRAAALLARAQPPRQRSAAPAAAGAWREPVAASAAFDLLTLAQVRRLRRGRAPSLRGWREGLRRDAPRAARAPPRRAPAAAARGWSACARRVAQQRRLWAACEPAGGSPARRAARGLPDAPAIHGRDRLHGIPGDFAVHVCPACGSGRTLPLVPTEQLGALYPERLQRLRAARQPAAARRGDRRCSAGATGARSGARRSPRCCGARRAGCSTSAAAAATSA